MISRPTADTANHSSADLDRRVDRLAEEYVARLRTGERPAITEYISENPDLEERIREVFPALYLVEGFAAKKTSAVEAGIIGVGDLTTIGDYAIVRQIGRGGMGIVYEAVHRPLKRSVALKILSPQLSNDEVYLQRFHREAQAAARMHHTNIVPVYDVGEEDGRHYYSMQLVTGQSLDELINAISSGSTAKANTPRETAHKLAESALKLTDDSLRRTVKDQTIAVGNATGGRDDSNVTVKATTTSLEKSAAGWDITDRGELCRQVARIGADVAAALQHAHSHGILHRDIKPANLLLDHAGNVWVTDFGLARTEGTNLTGTGDLVGTMRYMPPERFGGWADPRGDIYSLGLTLYELLVLRPAFDSRDQRSLMRQVLDQDPPSLRKIDSAIPTDLQTIISKAIDKEPSHRYRTAAELADDLQRFLEYRPIQAKQTSALGRFLRWRRRQPIAAALTATLASILLLVATGSLIAAIVFQGQSRRLADQGSMLNLQSTRLQEQTERLRHEQATTLQTLFDSYLSEASAYVLSNRPGRRYESLQAVRNAVALLPEVKTDEQVQQKLRSLAIGGLCLPDVRKLRTIDQFTYNGFGLMDSRLQYITRRPYAATHTELVRLHDRHVMWSVPYYQPICEFSPDSKLVAFTDNPTGRIQIIEIETGNVIFQCFQTRWAGFPQKTSFSADGRYFAWRPRNATAKIGLIRIVNLDAWLRRPKLKWPASLSLAQNPISDFAQTLAGIQDSESIGIHLRSIQTDIPQAYPFFTPSGDLFAYSFADDKAKVIDLQTEDVIWEQADFAPQAFSFRFNSDGRYFALGKDWGGGALIRDAAGRDPFSRVVSYLGPPGEHGSAVRSIAFSPDSKIVATSSWDGFARIFESATGKLQLKIPGGGRLQFHRKQNHGIGTFGICVGSSIHLYEYSSAPLAVSARPHGTVRPGGNMKPIDALAVSPDGRLVATVNGRSVELVDSRTLKPIGRVPGVTNPQTVHFHPDGCLIVTTDHNLVSIRLSWKDDVPGCAQLVVGKPKELVEVAGRVCPTIATKARRVAYSRGNDLYIAKLATGSGSLTEQQHLADLGRTSFQIHTANAAIDTNGRYVVSSANKHRLVVRDCATGKVVCQLGRHAENANLVSTFSPDSKLLIAATECELDGQVISGYHIWDTTRWQRLQTISGFNRYGAMSWSCDGSMLALDSHSDRFIELRSGRDFGLIATLDIGDHEARAIAFSPDQSRLYVIYADQVKMFDLQGIRQELAQLGLDWDFGYADSNEREPDGRPIEFKFAD